MHFQAHGVLRIRRVDKAAFVTQVDQVHTGLNGVLTPVGKAKRSFHRHPVDDHRRGGYSPSERLVSPGACCLKHRPKSVERRLIVFVELILLMRNAS